MLNWVPNKHINHAFVRDYLSNSEQTCQFTNYGPNVQLLETRIRDTFSVEDSKAVIVVNNGSTAIHVLAAAIQYSREHPMSWATQAFTFPPSAQSNLKNVTIIDIDLEGGLDLDQINLEEIDGIIVTNIFGNVVNIEKYETWTSDNNKVLLFDNAATAHTTYKGKNSVNWGVGCGISFHHTKPFGFGEGGAIIVDAKYENTVRSLINFGINMTDSYFVNEGVNGKMSDISAAYILQYLDEKFDTIVCVHNKLYRHFKTTMKDKNITFFKLFPSFHDGDKIVPACISILFDHYHQAYMQKLLESSILCRKYYTPLKPLKNSQHIYDTILCIPCTIDMTVNDIDTIIDILTTEYSNHIGLA